MSGRRYIPTLADRRTVEALAGYGVPEVDIAGLIGIDPKTLSKHYRKELDFGHVRANAKVAEDLFRKATGDGRESVTAAIFWLKSRARWKEISVTEHTGSTAQPVTFKVVFEPGPGPDRPRAALPSSPPKSCLDD